MLPAAPPGRRTRKWRLRLPRAAPDSEPAPPREPPPAALAAAALGLLLLLALALARAARAPGGPWVAAAGGDGGGGGGGGDGGPVGARECAPRAPAAERCARGARAGCGARHCHGCAAAVPLAGAPLASAPWFAPAGCALAPFSVAAARRCLAARRVFILGNSVARGLQFEALAEFGDAGSVVPRLQQKMLCEASRDFDEACRARLYEGGATELAYYDAHAFHGVARSPLLPRGFDPCHARHATTLDCLRGALAGAARGDVLVFVMGLSYAKTRRAVMAAGNQSADEWAAWLDDGLAEWRAAVAAAWKGAPDDVFRARLAHVRPWLDGGAGLAPAARAEREAAQAAFAAAVPLVNAAMDRAFRAEPWGIVDQWAINEGHDELYNDEVHFQGPLSRAAWSVVLNSLCGGEE